MNEALDADVMVVFTVPCLGKKQSVGSASINFHTLFSNPFVFEAVAVALKAVSSMTLGVSEVAGFPLSSNHGVLEATEQEQHL